jgi:hypothetical protein
MRRPITCSPQCAVSGFMMKLADRCDENGDPKA